LLSSRLRLDAVKKRMSEAIEAKILTDEDEAINEGEDEEASGLLANFIDLDPPLVSVIGKVITQKFMKNFYV
jgi:hypothetical protein